jgi:membrane-associated phospholipid phosphatase
MRWTSRAGRLWTVLAAAGLLAGAPLRAQEEEGEPEGAPVLTATDAWIAAGFAAGTVLVRPADRWLTDRLQQPAVQERRWIQSGATGFKLLAAPGSIILGGAFYGAGKLADHDVMAEVALHEMQAVAATTAVVYVAKGVFGRARPYMDETNPGDFNFGRGFKNDDYQSFPSGHTAAAFAMATVLTEEARYHRSKDRVPVAIVTYTAATLSGLSRMYDDKHWASDVIAGAAVGTLTSLAVVRYTHKHPNNEVDRRLLDRRRRSPPMYIGFSIPVH